MLNKLISLSIFKQFSLLSLTYIVTIASSLTITMILANTLSKEEFGVYRFALSFLPVLAIFTLPGINIAINKFAAQNKCVELGTIIKIKFKYGIIASFLAAIFATYFQLSGKDEYSKLLFILAVTMPFYELFYIYSYFLKGKKRFKKVFFYESLSHLSRLFAVLFVLLFSKNTSIILLAFLASKIVADYIFYKKVQSYNLNKKLSDKTNCKQYAATLINEGKQMNINYAITSFANNIDKLLIGFLYGPVLLAVYAVLNIVPTQISGFLNQSLNQLIFLHVIEHDLKKRKGGKGFLALLVTAVLIVLAYFLVWFVFPFIFPKYKEYKHLILLTLPFAFSLSILNSLWFVFTAKQMVSKLNKLQYLRIFFYSLSILFVYFLVPHNLKISSGAIIILLSIANLILIVYAVQLLKNNKLKCT